MIYANAPLLSATPYVAVLQAALLLGLALLVVLVIYDGGGRNPLVRAWLMHRLSGTRWLKVLVRSGVDPADWLRTTRTSVVNRHIACCRACPSKTHCDAVLNGRCIADADFSFCPNRPTIDAIRAAAR